MGRQGGAHGPFGPIRTACAGEPYVVLLSGRARRNVRESLPLDGALAAMETIDGSIAMNPYRAGKLRGLCGQPGPYGR